MDFTLTFIQLFLWVIYLASPLLLLLGGFIILLGLVVGKIEKWRYFDALYWALITATTVGYGDIRPVKKSSKVFSIILAFIGIMFTGIIVAITVNTASRSLDKHIDLQFKQQFKEMVK